VLYVASNIQSAFVQDEKFLKAFLFPVVDTKLAEALELMLFALDLTSELYRFSETLDRALIVRSVPLFLGPDVKVIYLDGGRGSRRWSERG